MDYGETAQMYFDGLMAQPILDGITMEQLQQQITDTLREIDKNFSDCYLSSALLTQKLQRFQPLQASALGALSVPPAPLHTAILQASLMCRPTRASQ